jgi:hypothetical protein
MVEFQPSKLAVWVRSPSPAPILRQPIGCGVFFGNKKVKLRNKKERREDGKGKV